jgi:hypothetical protein
MFKLFSDIYFVVYKLYYIDQNDDLGICVCLKNWDGWSILLYVLVMCIDCQKNNRKLELVESFACIIICILLGPSSTKYLPCQKEWCWASLQVAVQQEDHLISLIDQIVFCHAYQIIYLHTS